MAVPNSLGRSGRFRLPGLNGSVVQRVEFLECFLRGRFVLANGDVARLTELRSRARTVARGEERVAQAVVYVRRVRVRRDILPEDPSCDVRRSEEHMSELQSHS